MRKVYRGEVVSLQRIAPPAFSSRLLPGRQPARGSGAPAAGLRRQGGAGGRGGADSSFRRDRRARGISSPATAALGSRSAVKQGPYLLFVTHGTADSALRPSSNPDIPWNQFQRGRQFSRK